MELEATDERWTEDYGLSPAVLLSYNIGMRKRLYLQVGDRVSHLTYSAWGEGEVVEERHSDLAGGFCFVRVMFEDGNERSFVNDLDNSHCCYYAGVRIL